MIKSAIVFIDQGHIGARSKHALIIRHMANAAGAWAVGKALRRGGYLVMFSSSVDFPREYGARDADWRGYVREGYGQED